MSTKRGGSTLEEFHARLKAEGRYDEYIARKQEKTRQIAERAAQLREEQAPLLADLREVGWSVESVWDLVNTAAKYESAIPVLLKHLAQPYSDRIRGGIARALAVPEARSAWPVLVAAYREEPTPPKGQGGMGAKHGLAVALSGTVTDAVMDELVTLAKDRSHGESRGLLLSALKDSKLPIAKQAIAELAADADLAKEIASWKRGKR